MTLNDLFKNVNRNLFNNQGITGCGDCLKLMDDIPDKSVDMILCDLPYGTTSCKWDNIIPFERSLFDINGTHSSTKSDCFGYFAE